MMAIKEIIIGLIIGCLLVYIKRTIERERLRKEIEEERYKNMTVTMTEFDDDEEGELNAGRHHDLRN